MKYKLLRAVMNAPGFVELTAEEYDRIKSAKRCVLALVAIEDKFDMLLANYEELEQSLLDLSLHFLIYRDFTWSGYRTDTDLVNRRLINLLSTARLYLDQLVHDLTGLDRKGTELVNAVRTERRLQYDSKFGYRAMEEIRNHMQHRDLAVRGVGYKWGAVGPDPQTRPIQYTASPILDTLRLQKDKGFKPAILNELKTHGDTVPIKSLIREYMEGLAEVHEKVRVLTDDKAAQSEKVITETEGLASQHFSGDILGLAVIAEDEDGKTLETDDIFNEPSKRRQMLRRKNSRLKGLSRRYVSSVAEEHEQASRPLAHARVGTKRPRKHRST